MTATSSCISKTEKLSDASLMRAAAAGDETAFRGVFDRHVDAIRAYLVARVGFDAGSGSCGAFDQAGLMATYFFGYGRNAAAFSFSGIAADDVAAITLSFADGSTADVPLIQNGFLWRGKGEQRRPTRITTTRGGREFTSDNQFAREHDPNLM